MKITPKDKKMFNTYISKHQHAEGWKLGDHYELIVKIKNEFTNRKRNEKLIVIPVNGETNFNQVGLSHGFIHFEVNGKPAFAGISWFIKNAKKVN